MRAGEWSIRQLIVIISGNHQSQVAFMDTKSKQISAEKHCKTVSSHF